jgi:putative ABC transport system permease protein
MDESRKVVVIGEQARSVLFADENPIGKYVRVKGIHLLIVGELATDKTGDDAERVRSSLFVPFSTFQQAFNQRNRVGWFAVTAKPSASADDLETAIKATLSARHGVNPEDRDAIGSFNLAKQIAKVDGLFAGIRGFVWFVGTLTLLAGVLGVSNILLITVKERTREIGVRKALGATPWSVISMVVGEAVVLTSLSGYVGLVASVGCLELVSKLLENMENAPLNRPEVDLRVAIGATVILVLSGAVAGIVPARHAAKISPVEALRSE